MLLLEQFENLTLHPKNAARLKELVLQLAVQGKLTENWRGQNPDVEPAAELLKRIETEKAQLVKEKKIKKEKPLEPISEVEVPYTLPEGWSWCRMADIASKLGAGSTPKGGKEVYVEEGIPFLRSQNVYDDGLRLESVARITEAVHQKMSGTHVQPKDILLNITGGSIGRCALVADDFGTANVSQHVAIIRLVDLGIRKYIHYLMTSDMIQHLIMDVQVGVSREGLSMTKLREFLIPLPPLAEQEAIVARVGELMQKIEELEKQTAERIQLKQHLGTAALQQLTAATDEELEQNWLFLKQHFQTMFDDTANLKKLRETILQLAVQGKLTANWRTQNPTTEPAYELLKCIQAEKSQLVKEKKIKKEKPLEPISEDEVPYTLPEGWVWCRFGEVILDIEAGKSPSCDPQEASLEEWGVIKISAVSWGEFLERENKKLPPSVLPFEDKEIMPGDFIMSRANTADLIARSVVVGNSVRSKLLLNDKTLRVRFQSDTVKAYCNLFNNCSVARAYYKEVASGTSDSMKNIGREQIKDLLIPLPPEVEQQAIFSKVNQLIQLCDELEQQIQQSEHEAETLMQAVVQEALQVQEEEAV